MARSSARWLRWPALLCGLALALPAAAQQTAAAQPAPAAAARFRADLVRAAHSQWGLDAPVAAFAAQVHQESAWQPLAVSRVGARGMAQFMPATVRWWCSLNKLTAADCQPSNPAWALRALVGYDKWLYDRTPARYSPHDRLWVALRGYNGGLGHWRNEARLAGEEPSRAEVDTACGKASRSRLHCAENLGYPARILGMLQPLYLTWGTEVLDTEPSPPDDEAVDLDLSGENDEQQ